MKAFLVEEIKTRFNQGATDDELMQAYGLSDEELKRLYEQLIRAVADGLPYVHIRHD